MELGQSTAFLGAFVASGVLSVVLVYIGQITRFTVALNLWSFGYALNALRLLVYSFAGVAPASHTLFFLVEWCQVLQALSLLFGVLVFVGRPLSWRRHVLPTVAGTLVLVFATSFAWDGGPFRVLPFYVLACLAFAAAGIEIFRCQEWERNAGFTFTAVTLVLWSLHKLDFVLLPGGFSEAAQIRFMLSAGLYTAAALGFSIMALSVFHRRLVQAASENEARFRKMFEDAPVGYQSLDEEGRIVAVNRRWLDILGYAEDEAVGHPFIEFLSPAGRAAFAERFARFKQTNVASGVEFEMVRKDGEKIVAAFEGRINPSGDPNVVRTHCVLADVTEKRQQEALVTRLGRMVEATSDEIYVFDAESLKFTHANKGAIANSGFSLDELREMTPLDVNQDITRDAFAALVGPLRSGEQETAVFETRCRRKDGSTYDVEARLQLMAGEVPPVFLSVAKDISARKAAEKALMESEARLQAVMDHSPASIVLKDRDGRFILANREYLRRTSNTAESVIGRTLAEIESPEIAREAAAQEREVIESGRQQVFHVNRPYGDGRDLRMVVVRFVVPAADGSVANIGAIGVDITEWKKAEEALRESEARLQAIMDHSPAAIFLKDREDRFLVANREYLRRRHLRLEDVLGRTTLEVNTPEVGQQIWSQEQAVMASGQPAMYQVTRSFTPGQELTLAIMRFPILAPSGEVAGVGGISFDISEWKRAEDARRQSEARLQAILDHAPAEITLKDRDGRYLVANQAYLRRKGLASDDVLGKTVFDFTAASEAEEVHRQDEEILASRQAGNYRGSRERADGSKGTFAIVRFPLLDDKDEVANIGVISIDVTRERQAEAALRENEEKLRLVLESTGEGIYAVDLDGCCTLCNPAAARILGYDSPDELLMRDIHGLIHHSRADGSVYPPEDCPVHRTITHGEPLHGDNEVFWRRDGRPVPVEFRSNVVLRDDAIVGTVVSFADISQRKRAEAWLLRLSQSVEQGPFGVIITDGEHRIEYANPSFLQETGYSADEVLGRPASIRYADGPDSAIDREITEAIAGGHQWRGEVRHLRKNGDVYWASVLVSPIRDREGRTVAYVSVSEDVSERRRMAEHLRQAQKMEAVGQLTGGIAHDFNNILSVILTSAECLADDVAEREDMGKLVATIVRAVHRAAGLTQRLLAFSRRQDLSPEVTDLGMVVQDMADMLRRSLGETITVSVMAEPNVPPVVVDRGQFENALLNLAVNARDAMPNGGSLTVEVAPGDPPGSGGRSDDVDLPEFVCVTVTDTGTGMSSEVAERVFEPFFTTKGKGQGTGLGLSMVYGFVKQSGGDIAVDSVEGEGTSFLLFFPVADPAVVDSMEVETGPAEDDGVALPPLRIVLAEDDTAVCAATKFILEGAGHQVLDAGNGLDALNILKGSSDVDLLLTDVIMPGGLSGRDLAEAAIAMDPNLKVLFTSGYADGRLSGNDIIPGATAFLPKPYTKESLLAAIRALWLARTRGRPNG